jgi:ABC-type Na+ efflux pump permease subunit
MRKVLCQPRGKGKNMSAETQNAITHATYTKVSSLYIIWLIARRQMVEAVRTRSTLVMTGFFLVFQTILVLISLGPMIHGHLSPREMSFAGTLMAFYLLFVGLMPSTPAIGIASGVFAGDKERGCLTPLLVTPASNTAIFAGKVLGAVLPALAYSVIGIVVYLVEIALLYGPDKLSLLPAGLSLLILLIIPALALLGSTMASLISSRVNTFQSAQNYSSLLLMVLWFVLFVLVFLVTVLGLWLFAAVVAAIFGLDILLIVVGANTWRREEVMARQ